jgi:hypothetical protein
MVVKTKDGEILFDRVSVVAIDMMQMDGLVFVPNAASPFVPQEYS